MVWFHEKIFCFLNIIHELMYKLLEKSMHCQIHFSALMYYAYIYRGLSESIKLLLDAIVVLFLTYIYFQTRCIHCIHKVRLWSGIISWYCISTQIYKPPTLKNVQYIEGRCEEPIRCFVRIVHKQASLTESPEVCVLEVQGKPAKLPSCHMGVVQLPCDLWRINGKHFGDLCISLSYDTWLSDMITIQRKKNTFKKFVLSKKLECIKKFSIQILNVRLSRLTCYWRGSPQSFPGCSRVVDAEPEHWHHW